MNKKSILITIIAAFLAAGAVGAITLDTQELLDLVFKGQEQPTSVEEESLGGVNIGNEFNPFTQLATTSESYLIKTGRGTLGSIIINTAGTGNTVFYDATTTNANLRVKATSSLTVLGVIDASQAAGTYTYDIRFIDGLLEVNNGAMGTTTITIR